MHARFLNGSPLDMATSHKGRHSLPGCGLQQERATLRVNASGGAHVSESAASPFLSCSANAQGRRLMKRTREALHACNLWQTKETKKATEIRTKEEEDATDRPPAGRNLLYYSLVEHWRGTYSRNTTHTTPASRPAFHVDGRLVLTPLCA